VAVVEELRTVQAPGVPVVLEALQAVVAAAVLVVRLRVVLVALVVAVKFALIGGENDN
jgi:hypothetical protein